MEQALSFLSKFIETEFIWLKSLYSEPDKLFLEKQEQILKLCIDTYSLPAYRDEGEFEDILESYEGEADKIKPRTLFQVKHYNHPESGDIYRAYVSYNNEMMIDSYGNNLFAGKIDGEFKIISRYHKKGFHHDPEAIKGMEDWVYDAGIYFKTLGEFIEKKKITPPEGDDEDMADYNTE